MARQPPLLRAYYETAFNNSTTPKSVAVDWLAGDRITVLGITAGASTTINTPTAAGLTFVADGAVGTTGQCWANSWTATAAADGTAVSLAAAIAGTAQVWGFAVWVHSASEGWGNRVTSAAAAKTASLPRAQDNSAVLVIIGDFSAGAVTGYAWTPSGQTEREAALEAAGGYTVYAADWPDQGAAGTTSYGITGTASTGQHTIIAREVLGSGGSIDDPTFRYRQQAPGVRGPTQGPWTWVGQAGYPDVPTVTAEQVTLTEVTAGWQVQPLNVQPGPVSLTLTSVAATWAVQPVDTTVGPIAVTLTSVAASWQPQAVTVTPGPIALTLTSAAGVWQPQTLTVTPGPISLTLTSTAASWAVQPLEFPTGIRYVIGSEISGKIDSAGLSYVPAQWPTNLLAGDVVVLFASTGVTSSPAATANAPGGAAYEVGLAVPNSTLHTSLLLRRIAADGEGAPTITHAASANGTCAGFALRGVNASQILDVVAQSVATTATATNATLPALTPVTDAVWSVAGYGSRTAASPFPNLASGTGYTERQETKSTAAAGAGTTTSASTRDGNPLTVAGAPYDGAVFSHDIVGGARQVLIHALIRPAPVGGVLTLTSVAATWQVQPVTVTPGAVTLTLTSATATWAVQPVTVTPGPITVTLASVAAIWAPQPLSVAIGAQFITLTSIPAVWAARSLSVAVGAISVTLTSVAAAWQARAVTVTVGPISVTLTSVTAVWAAQPLNVTTAQVAALASVAAVWQVRAVTVAVGAVQLQLASVAAVWTPQAVQLVMGAIVLTLTRVAAIWQVQSLTITTGVQPVIPMPAGLRVTGGREGALAARPTGVVVSGGRRYATARPGVGAAGSGTTGAKEL